MFRSPLEMSSGSESESDVGLEKVDSDEQGSAEIIERQTTDPEALSSQNDFSAHEEQNYALPQSNLNDHHAGFLLAGLLENYSRVRAAEMLNASSPGVSYTRHSQEVRPLAEQLFSRSSHMLAAHQVLPASFTSQEAQRNRSQYMNAIDAATLRTLQGTDKPDAQHFGNLLTADMINMTLAPALSLPSQSPYQDMILSQRSPPLLGRYHSEFQQVRLLGQGGYGRVFHVVNAVDRQHYAVKRIPLSPRVYSRWLQGGDESARTHREISMLARLDHPNIVRYFGAWLEAPPTTVRNNNRSSSKGRQKLLTDRPALANSPNRTKWAEPVVEHSDDIVFGDDTDPDMADAGKLERSVQHLIAEMPSRDQQTTSTHSMRDSEVFTDDRSRALASPEMLSDNTPILCIQMGLHPMTLSTYLTPLPEKVSQPIRSSTIRHCFHLVPSLRLLLGIICGLQYLHRMGAVHRDIKPGNILLSESPLHDAVGFYDVGSCHNCPEKRPHFLNPRIADFGLVADIEKSTQFESSPPYKAAGTELYRPPVSSIESTNEKLDVFALGVLLFELLWHFGTKTERAMVLSGLQKGEVPPTFPLVLDVHCGTGIGTRVVNCIKSMVNINSKARWDLETVRSWADDMLKELETSSSSARDIG